MKDKMRQNWVMGLKKVCATIPGLTMSHVLTELQF